MLLSAVDIINVTLTLDGSRNTYDLPLSFASIGHIEFTSTDLTIVLPNFMDYTMSGNVLSVPGTYNGQFDIYYNYNSSDQWTLDLLITETLLLVDNQKVVKDVNGDYQGKSLTEVRKIITSLNRAKNKIAKEKFQSSFTERITLGSNGKFSVINLTKLFMNINSLTDQVKDVAGKQITDSTGMDVIYEWMGSSLFICPHKKSGDILNLEYSFLPRDMSFLTDVLDFPELIDPRILCYFAAYQYDLISSPDDPTLAGNWLNLWNDGFDSIFYRSEYKPIKDVYRTNGINGFNTGSNNWGW